MDKADTSDSAGAGTNAFQALMKPVEPEALHWCQGHKTNLPVSHFGTNRRTGALLKNCARCLTTKASYNARADIKEEYRNWRNTASGKASSARRREKYENTSRAKETRAAYLASDIGKAATKRNRSSDRTKAIKKRYYATEEYAAVRKRYRTSDKGVAASKAAYGRFKTNPVAKAAHAATGAAWQHTDAGKRSNKRRNAKPINRIRRRLYKMTRNTSYNSSTVRRLTPIASNADFRAHLESTFAGWMNWTNQGRHETDAPYQTKWQIGHKIPCVAFDNSNPEDLGRCFALPNLFAQCARENLELHTKLPSANVLLKLRAFWPVAWNDKLPTKAQEAAWADRGYSSDEDDEFDSGGGHERGGV